MSKLKLFRDRVPMSIERSMEYWQEMDLETKTIL